jgi:dienelactone hydrolase
MKPLLILAAVTAVLCAHAASPRALPVGQLPNDVRLAAPRTLDSYFPFEPPASMEAWKVRADHLRTRMRVALGLWPMPAKTPLNAVIHGRIDRGEFTVEKVFFESRPGFFVTGNLYRPKNAVGQRPGVLFAHGHWDEARFADNGEEGVREEIASGQERFEEGGRSRFQAMSVQLARMGCVVFQYDMVGYCDAKQIPEWIAHAARRTNAAPSTDDSWLLFTPQAEGRLQSVMMLQAWNSIRALDFLLGLPEVDPGRVAMTGASGGGTQTFITAALDDRVKLAFPAVMVSTGMQGGCTCENATLLRIDGGNVDFAALCAPRPQGLTSADDWTREMATKGFPQLRALYGLHGAADKVALFRGEQFPHNYNAVARMAFFTFLNQQFALGFKNPVIERDYQRLTQEQMTVWDAAHPKPPGGDDFERRLLKDWERDTRLPDGEEGANLRRTAWKTLLRIDAAGTGAADWRATTKEDHGKWTESVGLLRRAGRELPLIVLEPDTPSGGAVVWLSARGKEGLREPDGSLQPGVIQLLEAGRRVIAADLFGQGEFVREPGTAFTNRMVKGYYEAAAYTYGYNDSVLASQVQDAVTVLDHARQLGGDAPVAMVALGATGPVGAGARAFVGEGAGRDVIETGGFRFADVTDFSNPGFQPGAVKYGDLTALLQLAAGRPALLVGDAPAGSGPGIERVASASSAQIAAFLQK